MKLSIITLNYKKPNLTIACLKSLYEQYKKEFESSEFECIVVDNNSQDNSVPVIQDEIKKHTYKNVRLIANKYNAGFGAGNNLGAFKSKGKYSLFLNNDTQVKDKNLIRMVSYMDNHSDIAILGGQLCNIDGSLQPSMGKFYTPLRTLILLLGLQRFGMIDKSPTQIQQVDWVKGALLMIRRKVFDALHGFDENIFMYTEDMELCFRAKIAGYKTYFYPQVSVFHAEQGSSNRTFAIVNIYKNLLYFYKKHRSPGEYAFVSAIMKCKAHFLITFGKIFHNTYLSNTYEEALSVLR